MLSIGQRLKADEYNADVAAELNANGWYCKDISDGEYVYQVAEVPPPTQSELINRYIPTASASANVIMKAYFKTNAATLNLTTDEKIQASGLCDTWTAGKHTTGEIVNVGAQTWECTQTHDNAIYPDINPDNPQTWANFWKPLHGTTPKTARPWTKPVAGTTDMYLVGEYMVWTDGKTYKCLRNTVYSPSEYAPDWEIISQ